MKKLILSIILAIASLPSFSQNVTDTASIVLPSNIARLVIQDLISGDAAKQELYITRKKLDLVQSQITTQEEIIFRLEKSIDNLEKIETNREEQIDSYEELSDKLSRDLEIEKKKNKILTTVSSGLGAVAIILLIL